jgi:hypothetical protein
MLVLARDVPDIMDLECLHGTADIELGLSLHGISHPHMRNSYGGLVARGWFVIDGDKTNYVELISDVLVQIERTILRVPEVENDRVSPANRPWQRQGEKAGRVRF